MNLQERIEAKRNVILPILTALLSTGHYTEAPSPDYVDSWPGVLYRKKGRLHQHSKFVISAAVEDAIELADDFEEALNREAESDCRWQAELAADERAEGSPTTGGSGE